MESNQVNQASNSEKDHEIHLLNDDENYEFTFKKTLDPNIKLEPVTPTKNSPELEIHTDNTAEKRQKLNDGKIKKRIRNLSFDEDETENKHKQHKRSDNKRGIPYFKYLFILLSVGVVCVAIFSEKIRNDLLKNYQNQYNSLIHGKTNFCTEELNFKNITDNLRKKLIGQDNAIEEMENLFKNHKDFTSMAIIGGSGVGKTYTTSLIEETFQWNENIQFYIWNTESGNEGIKNIEEQIIPKFTECGHNLLFIDDLGYEDRNYVQTINEILKRYTISNKIKLIVFYIFNLNKNSDMSEKIIKSHADTLRLLENINVINYQNLNKNDILNCIKLISESLDISLTDYQKMEVLKLVTELKSGCKNVMAKIFLFSKN